MKNKTIIVAVVIALVVGLGVGYVAGSIKHEADDAHEAAEHGHVMPNGEMMSGSGEMDMGEAMSAMNAGLKGKSGDAFDQAFLSEMIVHHEGAVEMARLALTNAKHQEIKDLANAIIAAQNKEIADMKAWSKSWFNK